MNQQSLFIGRYRVVEEIGRGGMGIVYLGEDPLLERVVAIKVLPPKKLKQKSALNRFLREARVSARLDHPNIIKVYDVNEEEGIYHIVMEYVAGDTLRDLIENRTGIGQVDVAGMSRLFVQIGRAMEYAHGLKIIHRDLKPENIKVTPGGVAKVMDFGLACLEDRHSLTEAGAVMGTIAYFSPEQARGEKVDFRTDIYSLGMVFYEMLTNDLPFTATNPSEMIQKHLNEPPVAPSTYNPNIPRELDELVLKALEKRPQDRFQSVKEMIDIIEPPAPPRENNFFKEMKAPVEEKPVEEKIEEPEVSLAGPDEVEEVEEIEEVGEAPVPEVPFKPEEKVSHYDGRYNGLRNRPEVEEKVPPREEPVSAMPSGAGVAMPVSEVDKQEEEAHWKQYARVMDQLRRDEDARLKAGYDEMELGPVSVVCAVCGMENSGDKKYCEECGSLITPASFASAAEAMIYHRQGLHYMEAGKYKDARYEFEEALHRDPNLLEARLQLGRALAEMGETGQAEIEFKEVMRLSPGDPKPHIYAGDMFRTAGDRKAAIESYREALRREPGNATLRCRLAFLYAQEEDVRHAIEEYQMACAFEPYNLEANRQLGFLLAAAERNEEAITAFEKVIELDPGDEQAFQWLGRLYSRLNQYGNAERAYQTALSINPDNPDVYSSLGAIYERQKKEDQAVHSFKRAISIDQGNLQARLSIADYHLKHDQPSRALEEMEQAVSYHPQDPEIHRRMGELYLRFNQLDRALDHFEKTIALSPGSAELHNRLGKLYQEKKIGEKSVQEYQRAVELSPYNADYHENLGMAYYSRNDLEGAINEMRKAATLDGRNSEY
ncbi:MAG: tetratricopeptide repeat protein, partial [Chloroflexi bacterium]|nr:tetratricopeptide repeat protein [Chloroflexota bacterium]